MKLVKFIKNFAREDDGVTAIEYGLIAALIAVVIIASVQLVGQRLDAVFDAVAAALLAA
jgi:pilus assembly protein Flp/PilA